MDLPEATRVSEHEAVKLGEAVFSAGRTGVDDAVEALKKFQAHSHDLVEAIEKIRRDQNS